MTVDLLARVRAALESSELLCAAGAVRRDGGVALALGDVELRPLHAEEIARLEAQGNSADDWGRVRVASGFDWRRVRQVEFHGDVVLGRFDWHTASADVPDLPSGIYRATLSNCVIGHEALVRDVRWLADCVVGPAAALFDCGSVGGAACLDLTLALGIETGGRDVPVFAEIDVAVASAVTRCRADRALLAEYAKWVGVYAAQARSPRTIIRRGAVVQHVPLLHNAYVGACARIDHATGVSAAVILSNEEEPSRVTGGACVRDSVLQWGTAVDTLAVVERSVLTEYSSVAKHAKVTESLLGPNTAIAEGEVTASLVGPFVNMHHQALLIATLWPEGKGNISHGANAGSNHTGKAPDQEFWPGEGTFLGLGVNIKFPVNLTKSPYSIVACGVQLLPQRVEFPFALINVPAEAPAGLPAGLNEIMPAWQLTDNLYAVRRNEAKYRARNRARRLPLEMDVFRPDTVDLMRDALARLEGIAAVKEFYTERDIPGLGKSFLIEQRRRAACAGYRLFIRLYALSGLKDAVAMALSEGNAVIDDLLQTPSEDRRWEHQRRLLIEDLDVTDVAAALAELPTILEKTARDVERSKAKDDERGVRIIDDYPAAHGHAAGDPYVLNCRAQARQLQAEVQQMLINLGPCHPAIVPWREDVLVSR